MRVDPSKVATNFDSTSSTERKYITPGRKIMVPIGLAFKQYTNRNGEETELVEVTSVCIADLEKQGEEGCIFSDTFYKTENALWRIANWAVAMGHKEAFDIDVDSDVQRIMLRGAFSAMFKEDHYTNKMGEEKVGIKLQYYDPAKGKRDANGHSVLTDAQKKIVQQAEENFHKILEWRIDNRGDRYRFPTESAATGSAETAKDNSYDEIPF